MDKFRKFVKSYKDMVKYIREIYWAQVLRDTIAGCEFWSDEISVSLGRWAMGYPGMYALVRSLNDAQPEHILELGLGQTTKATSAYVNWQTGRGKQVEHIVVEHNQTWIDFFAGSNQIGNSKILRLELEERVYNSEKIYGYRNFAAKLRENSTYKYDLVIIDAPFGGGKFSRVDILGCLPGCLRESWIIIVDDTNRKGEKHLIRAIEKILRDNALEYRLNEFEGEDNTTIIASIDRKYLCSI